jgi:tRNA threonylcarbamoyladenosine biosynthesis protein TsaB
MITLFIDTTSHEEIIVRLTIDEKVFEEKRKIHHKKTQVVLPLIKQLLEHHQLHPEDIQHVEVNPGSGSFTGIRVGVSIANALIFGLGLSEDLIEPIYT